MWSTHCNQYLLLTSFSALNSKKCELVSSIAIFFAILQCEVEKQSKASKEVNEASFWATYVYWTLFFFISFLKDKSWRCVWEVCCKVCWGGALGLVVCNAYVYQTSFHPLLTCLGAALFMPIRFMPTDSCRLIHAPSFHARSYSCRALFMPSRTYSCPYLFMPTLIHALQD